MYNVPISCENDRIYFSVNSILFKYKYIMIQTIYIHKTLQLFYFSSVDVSMSTVQLPYIHFMYKYVSENTFLIFLCIRNQLIPTTYKLDKY